MRSFIVSTLFVLVACGGGVSQSDDCKKYLACTEAASPGSAAQYSTSYGEAGSCWATTRGAADTCTVACKQGLDTLKAGLGMNKTECQ